MDYRAAKSGLSAETQSKIRGKYDAEYAGQQMEWIKQRVGGSFSTSGDIDNVKSVLENGEVLSRLVNTLKPGTVSDKKIESSKRMTFKQRELVEIALKTFKEYNVSDAECFQVVDLVEGQNLHQVIICLGALGRKLGIGPKEAQENKRDFTDEQLKAGQSVIGLQMGTNQGASQAGMNMGKMRMITNDEK